MTTPDRCHRGALPGVKYPLSRKGAKDGIGRGGHGGHGGRARKAGAHHSGAGERLTQGRKTLFQKV